MSLCGTIGHHPHLWGHDQGDRDTRQGGAGESRRSSPDQAWVLASGITVIWANFEYYGKRYKLSTRVCTQYSGRRHFDYNHIREVSKVFDYNFTPRAYSWVWGPVPRARATSWLCLWFVQFIRTTFFQAPTKISKVFCWLLIEMIRNDNRQLIRQLIIRWLICEENTSVKL